MTGVEQGWFPITTTTAPPQCLEGPISTAVFATRQSAGVGSSNRLTTAPVDRWSRCHIPSRHDDDCHGLQGLWSSAVLTLLQQVSGDIVIDMTHESWEVYWIFSNFQPGLHVDQEDRTCSSLHSSDCLAAPRRRDSVPGHDCREITECAGANPKFEAEPAVSGTQAEASVLGKRHQQRRRLGPRIFDGVPDPQPLNSWHEPDRLGLPECSTRSSSDAHPWDG